MSYIATHPKNRVLNEEGFTLLEIIAVIVIMSILAVVAVPKYFNLQDEARRKAFAAGMSEAIGRVNGYFAEQVLGGTKPADISYTNSHLGGTSDSEPIDMGDFLLNVQEETDGNITLTVTGKPGTEMEGVESQDDVVSVKKVPKPGVPNE